ncbi:MAG: hypothetical protein ACHQ0Y_15260 [Thermodesulfovibrionales bacterium]
MGKFSFWQSLGGRLNYKRFANVFTAIGILAAVPPPLKAEGSSKVPPPAGDNSRRQIVALVVVAIALLSLSFLVGCAGMVFAPKKQILFYHEELVQADRSVSEAAAGKDKECLEEFNNVRDMRDRAYEVYWSCRTKEAIELAKEAMILGRSLCPPKPMAEVKPEPMPEPPPLPLPPPPPPEPVKEPAPEEPLLMAGREHVRVEGRAVAVSAQE